MLTEIYSNLLHFLTWFHWRRKHDGILCTHHVFILVDHCDMFLSFFWREEGGERKRVVLNSQQCVCSATKDEGFVAMETPAWREDCLESLPNPQFTTECTVQWILYVVNTQAGKLVPSPWLFNQWHLIWQRGVKSLMAHSTNQTGYIQLCAKLQKNCNQNAQVFKSPIWDVIVDIRGVMVV